MLKKRDFKRVYSEAESTSHKSVVVLCIKNNLNINRLGIVASKKTGGSVMRNSARRRIKEIYRLSEADIIKGYDIVIIARQSIHAQSYIQLTKSVLCCLDKFKILEKKNI